MPQLEANGQTLYYEQHGEGDPLLCVMGLATDSVAWIPPHGANLERRDEFNEAVLRFIAERAPAAAP